MWLVRSIAICMPPHALWCNTHASATTANRPTVRLTPPSNRLQAQLKELSKIGLCPRDLSCIATAALSRWQLTPMGPLGANHLLAGIDAWLRPLRSRPAAVAGMSALQVGLLVAAQRLEDQGHGTFNFEVRVCCCVVWGDGRRRQVFALDSHEPITNPPALAMSQMVFDEFLKAKNESLGPLWRKPAAWRAFRDVVSTGLVQFAAARLVHWFWAFWKAGQGWLVERGPF